MRSTIRFPAVVPELTGESIRLRELNETDIPAWFARATDAESADLAGDPIPGSIEAGIAWLQRHRQRFREKTAIRWAIDIDRAAESVGTVGLTLAAESDTAELSVVVARRWWRQGVATAAACRVTQYAFDVLGVQQIQAEALLRNVASRRMLEKLRFQPLRTPPGDDATCEDPDACCLYVLRRQAGAKSTARRTS